MTRREVVFSGMRPTGRLHLGNYWGALKNWVALQKDYDCFYSVVDWHMLTTGYSDTTKLREHAREMVLDWLAAGLDPQKCVIFKQSEVPEHAELALLLGMVTPLSSLENNPTWKEQLQELSKTKLSRFAEQEGPIRTGVYAKVETEEAADTPAGKHELRTYGFLGYPVLQAADILLYRGTKVPVGQDQLPHLELSREIARRFNNVFGTVFQEPQPLLTPTPKVPGCDGRKMSKSYGNTLDIAESDASVRTKIMAAYTDPLKIKKDSPGHPEPCPENPPGCTVFALHKLYAAPDFVGRRGSECRAGSIGCVACKKDLLSHMEPAFTEFRKARERYEAEPDLVDRVLAQGAEKARAVAQKTMSEVRRAMRLQ